MARIKSYRMDGYRIDVDEPEFYLKLERDNGGNLMNVGVDGEGIYYYRRGSQILTPKENSRTRSTYDGFMSMEVLRDVFECLRKIGWRRSKEDDQHLRVSIGRGAVTLVLDSTPPR